MSEYHHTRQKVALEGPNIAAIERDDRTAIIERVPRCHSRTTETGLTVFWIVRSDLPRYLVQFTDETPPLVVDIGRISSLGVPKLAAAHEQIGAEIRAFDLAEGLWERRFGDFTRLAGVGAPVAEA